MKRWICYAFGLILLTQSGWGMRKSQAVFDFGEKLESETNAVPCDNSEKNSKPSIEIYDNSLNWYYIFAEHQEDSDVSVKYGSKQKGLRIVDCIVITIKDKDKYKINLDKREIVSSEIDSPILDSIADGIIKIKNYYKLVEPDKPKITTSESQSDDFKAFKIKTRSAITVLDKINLIWDGVWLSLVDTSYEGSLAIDAPRVQTVGLVNCGQLYVQADSGQRGGFVNWGNLIVNEAKIFSKIMSNIGYIGSDLTKEDLPEKLPTLEDVQDFRRGRYSSNCIVEKISNIGKIDISRLVLADVSLSSSGDIKADYVKQSGEGCFMRLGHDLYQNLQLEAAMWKDWMDAHYKQNWPKFETFFDRLKLKDSILSLDVKNPVNVENSGINVADKAISIKSVDFDNTKIVEMNGETVSLNDILPAGVKKQDLEFDLNFKQIESLLKRVMKKGFVAEMLFLKNSKTEFERPDFKMVILKNQASFFIEDGRKLDFDDPVILKNKLFSSDNLMLEFCVGLSDENIRNGLVAYLKEIKSRPSCCSAVYFLLEFCFCCYRQITTVGQLKEKLSEKKVSESSIANVIRGYILRDFAKYL